MFVLSLLEKFEVVEAVWSILGTRSVEGAWRHLEAVETYFFRSTGHHPRKQDRCSLGQG